MHRLSTAIITIALILTAAGTGGAQVPPTSVEYSATTGGLPGCNQTLHAQVYEPAGNGPFPLFLYFTGTTAASDDYLRDTVAPKVAAAMVLRGYVSAIVQWDVTGAIRPDYVHNKAACIFDPNSSSSAVAALCSRGNVNCNLGIKTWGHSQGAALALMGGAYDARVRAAWITGMGNGLFGLRGWMRTHWLLNNRYRLVNGASDIGIVITGSSVVANNSEITGVSCPASPCLIAGGDAGWLIVPNGKPPNTDYYADHCWFKTAGCGYGADEASWESGSYDFSLQKSASWLAAAGNAEPQPARFMVINFASLLLNSGNAPRQFESVYPWGVADWGTAATLPSNFWNRNGVAGPVTTTDGPSLPASDTQARHATIGSSTAPATAQFSFWGAQGRSLGWVHVYYAATDATDAHLTIETFRAADGGANTPVSATLKPNQWATVPVGATNVRRVRMTSDKGDRVKFDYLLVAGTAPSKIP